jgi:N-acetyl-anhydromuramyl-L-alanine amidase AmpD
VRETPRRAVPRAALQARLQPFVNDPNDLFLPPKADRPWRFIVLHHSAHSTGNYAQIDREHRQVLGWQGCGYHFVIGNGSGSPDGQIEVAQRWAEQKGGAHCRNGKTPEVNEYGIGICLIGNFDESPPTPRQVEATRALVAYLSDRYHVTSDRIGPHSLLASGPTACPGKNFPATAILGSRGLASLNER